MKKIIHNIFIVTLSIVVTACGGSGGSSPDTTTPSGGNSPDSTTPPVLQTISVTPTKPTPLVRGPGETFQFKAIGNYSDGTTQDVTDQANWQVDDTEVATVDNVNSKGVVSFIAEGTTTLTATYNGASGQASLETTADSPPLLQTTSVTPAMLTRGPGETFQFNATGNYSDGTSQDVTDMADWQVNDTTIATVDNVNDKGLVSFIAEGTATLIATYGGASGQAGLSVTSPGPVLGPLVVSTQNPRYFEDADGQIVLLTGSHTWLNAQDGGPSNPPAQFDYNAWLDFLEQHNHNFFRLWIWEQATWTVNEIRRVNFSPTPYLRTGPGTAIDGGLKFDVSQFNQVYFDRVRQRIIDAGQRGIYVSVMLFNGWSVAWPKGSHDTFNPWHGHPYNAANNINGINGDKNGDDSGIESHELGNLDLTAVQEKFVKKMIDTVNDLDNVLYEISNESHSGSTAWQTHMIDFIRDYEAGKPKQHPVGMTVNWPGGQNSELFASSADWISINGDLDNPSVADGSKVIISDTDHLCGICGSREWAWKSFTQGENPIFMDPYIDVYGLLDIDLNYPPYVSLRENLGYIRSYSQRIDLAKAETCGALSSTQYCLGYTSGSQAEYLIYSPGTGDITIDLSGANVEFNVEWFDPVNGVTQSGGTVTGGSSGQVFQSPLSNDSVLFLSTGAM
jgi:hypothetical protein